MKTKVGSDEYSIRFRYKQFETVPGKPETFRRFTGCSILKNGELLQDKWVKCKPSEPYTKEGGRRYSLRDAVANLPRDIRGAILFMYYNRKKK